MKKVLFVSLLSVVTAGYCLGQAAGNWLFNQSKVGGSLSRASANEEAYFNNNDYNYHQQATVPSYNYPGYYSGCSQDTVITVCAKILMNVKADSYQAILGVSQVCDSIERGHKLINARIEKFVNNIIKLGISRENIYIDFISQVPIFEYEIEKKLFSKNYNEIPKGFELKKNVHINYTDRSVVDKLLIEAAKSEIYDIIKVDYFIDDIEEVYAQMRDSTIVILNGKVEKYKGLGVKFIPMYHTVSESINSIYPIERYEKYGTFNYASLSAISRNDNNKYFSPTNEQTSIYYNKLPYKYYDAVINPVGVEPVVQFVYTLTMKYVLKKQ
ncbi:MAG: hypothetical protein KJ607_01630 [Bacteroidetes bacterium]|nr:hypothetical protein [Bacteroidota bacterium]